MHSVNYRVAAGEDLSLSGGASMSSYVFFKLSITSARCRFAFKRRRRPSRVALDFELLCGWGASLHASERGPERFRACHATNVASGHGLSDMAVSAT